MYDKLYLDSFQYEKYITNNFGIVLLEPDDIDLAYSQYSDGPYDDYGNMYSDGGGYQEYDRAYSDYLYDNYSNSYGNGHGAYSNTYEAYDEYSNHRDYDNYYNYSNNNTPQISGNVSTTNNLLAFNNNIPFSWQDLYDPLASNQSSQQTLYRIYYCYKSATDTDYGIWTLLDTVSTILYNWNVAAMPNGKYKIAITGFDGSIASAVLSTDSKSFIKDPKGSTLTYIISEELLVLHYNVPSWGGPVGAGEFILDTNTIELQNEVNKVKELCLQSKVTFSTIVKLDTMMSDTHVLNLRQTAQEIRNTFNKPQKTWINNALIKGDEVKGLDILELRALLENLFNADINS